jgi:hypothetical protein
MWVPGVLLECCVAVRAALPHRPCGAENGDNTALVKAVVCAGLYPNIIVVEGSPLPTGEPKLTTRQGDVFLHPSTVCSPCSLVCVPWAPDVLA